MILNEKDFTNEITKAREVINKNKKVYSVDGKDGIKLYGESHIVSNSKISIVISPGFTEYINAYDEMVYYFNQLGYSTFGIEHRGNARSKRLGMDDRQVHVENFEDYVVDFNNFIENVVKKETDNDLYLLGHSMGGAIGARHLECYPNCFKKAALLSPMFGINTGGIPVCLAKVVAGFMNKIGKSKKYVFGKGPYLLKEQNFETSGCSSKERWKELAYNLESNNAEFQCGGPSFGWLYQSLKGIKKIQKNENKKKIRTPMYVFRAYDDVYVDEKGEDKFVKNLPLARIKGYANTRHEIFKAPNDILEVFLKDLMDYFNGENDELVDNKKSIENDKKNRPKKKISTVKKVIFSVLGVFLVLVLSILSFFLVEYFSIEANKKIEVASDDSPLNNKIKSKVDKMLLDENNLSKDMKKAREYISKNKKSYTFKGVGDVDIYSEGYDVKKPKAAIVLSHGYTESIYSYEEIIYYLNKMGYSAYMLEDRGHGRSQRLGIDDYQINVDSFDDYVTDLNTFVEEIVKPNTKDIDLYLYGVSMGGLVAIRYLECYPDTFKKALASSPMLALSTRDFHASEAKVLAYLASYTFWGDCYCPGHIPYPEKKHKFSTSASASEARFEEITMKAKKEVDKIATGDASLRWLAQAFKCIDKTLDKDNVDKIKTPMLMCQVINDTMIDNSGQNKFIKLHPECRLRRYKDARHELYKAPNDILDKYLTDVFDFFEN